MEEKYSKPISFPISSKLQALKNTNPSTYPDLKEIKTVVHDVNNFINNIINGIELLKDNRESKEKFTYLIERIENSTYNISDLINNLVNPYKSDNKTQLTKIHIHSLLKEASKIIQNNLTQNFELILNLKSEEDTIKANYSDVFRIFINILINSKEALQGNGKIIVSTTNYKLNSEERIKISIEDNGSGIAKDYLDVIFEEGFTTKNKKRENGLGLFIVKNLVEKYKGLIEVESKENEFTNFNISFPLYRNNFSNNLSQKIVLIAEDDPFQREVLSELLNYLKLKVISVSNGREALKKFIESEVDLMIVDQSMPIMDGLSCINEIRKLNSELPIILASGSTPENKLKLLNNVKVLSKPYNFQTIEELLNEVWD